MNKDKKLLYIVSTIAFAVLLVIFLLTAKNSAIFTAVAMALIALAVYFMIKKRSSLSIGKREVLLLTSIMAALYVILMLTFGSAFAESYKNPYFVNPERLFTVIIPVAVIIIASEIIRYVLLCQKNTYANVISWLICVTAELLTFSGIANIENFNHFMDLVGMTLFPAITLNVYCHYVSKRFGALPNIAFRLVCTLYVYFAPIYSEIPSALHACIKILVPLVMLVVTTALFERKKKNASSKGTKASFIATAAAVAIVISTAMLISCQFRYGAIVIATESMTGEINKGDMIIYERYDDQPIKEGQVIVFLKQDSKIIHRVIKIENVGNEIRYYTKGDANKEQDLGYVTRGEIVGLTDMKVAYVGYPTLWLRELLQATN